MSKIRKLAALKQSGFFNAIKTDFFNGNSLRRKESPCHIEVLEIHVNSKLYSKLKKFTGQQYYQKYKTSMNFPCFKSNNLLKQIKQVLSPNRCLHWVSAVSPALALTYSIIPCRSPGSNQRRSLFLLNQVSCLRA